MRKILITFSILLLICILVFAVVIYYIDLNKLKQKIIDEVQQRTGYQLAIAGVPSWIFFPGLGIKIEHMTVTAPQQAAPFAQLTNVKIIPKKVWELWQEKKVFTAAVNVNAIQLGNLHTKYANFKFDWQDGNLIVDLRNINLYGGQLKGVISGYEIASMNPRFDGNLNLKDIQLKLLIQDVSNGKNKLNLSGIAKGTLNITSEGKTIAALLSHLNGTGEFMVTKGVIEGIDLNFLVRSADAWLNTGMIPPNTFQTKFDALTSSVIIKNGVASTTNLHLKSNAFETEGQGSVNLNNKVLDFQLNVKPKFIKRINLAVPIKITGVISEPQVRLDKTKLQKFKEELRQIIPGKAGEIIQNLLGR